MFSVLVIAGSDSCAGAGMQIDLKTATAHGVYATCALTAVTAQNTMEVTAIQPVAPDVVEAQIEAVFADIPPQAIKIGMLGSADVANVVADALERHPGIPVVLDPVLVATAGATLSKDDVIDVFEQRLFVQSTIVTPNLPELAALAGRNVASPEDIDAAVGALRAHGASAVLVKGGHGDDDVVVDRLYDADGSIHEFKAPRVAGEYHGTGCTTATAIACNLAAGRSVFDSVREAHQYLHDPEYGLFTRDYRLGHGSRILI